MNVSCEKKLKAYQELLLKWNRTINLISKGDEANIWDRHIMDSLQLMNFIDPSESVIDVGSGAGFPGLILSIAGVSNVTLVESDSRKVAFLLQASKLSGSKVSIINERVEDLPDTECDWITSRAFAALPDIFKLTKNIEAKKGYLLLKGKGYSEEIELARKERVFSVDCYDSIFYGGKILKIKLDESKSFFDC